MADWIGIDSSHQDSQCHAGDGGHLLSEALNGTDYWWCWTSHQQWFILDLGENLNVTKARGRSFSGSDPIDVDIFVSTDKVTWGTAVAEEITTWQDRTDWDGTAVIDLTPKVGRYIKIDIVDTESVDLKWGRDVSCFPIIDIYAGPAATEVFPDTFELAATLHAPTVSISATVTPATLALAATLLAPGISIDATVSPATQELVLSQQVPNLSLGCTVSPAALALALTLHAPTVDTGAEVIVYPDTFELEATLHSPKSVTFWDDMPPEMLKTLIEPYGGGAWLWLCQIVVAGQDTVRIARNTVDVNYAGEDFEKFNMQIGEQLFTGDGSIPRVTLRIFQDRNRKIEEIINATEGALGAQVKLIRVNENYLETPVAALEADYDNLASESDTEWVTFTLGVPNPLTQRFPLRIYSSSMCPWTTPTLFKGPRCQYTGDDTSCTGTYEDCYTKGNAVHWGGELGLNPNVVKI